MRKFLRYLLCSGSFSVIFVMQNEARLHEKIVKCILLMEINSMKVIAVKMTCTRRDGL